MRQNGNGRASDNPDSHGLDDGLRVAFGAPAGAVGVASSVLRTLDARAGHCTRVILRDTPSEATAIVRPLSEEARLRAARSRYQIHGEIARGGVGIIYQGRDQDLGRDVAVKMLRDDHLANPSMIRRFVEEAQIAGQLQHPGILPVYELGLALDSPYFSMKLVRGKTLAALLGGRAHAAEGLPRFLAIFEQVCQTMAYAHAKGVIHRDLKPANILVGAFGEVQVVDWGLAKVLSQGGLADEARAAAHGGSDESVIETIRTGASYESLAGTVMGTPAYMPPEQANGFIERLDERCDVFALGAILCEILTGEPPYVGPADALLGLARAGNLVDVWRRLETCSADRALVDLTGRCLELDPAERPRDALAVAEAMSKHQADLLQRARDSELSAARAETRAAAAARGRRRTILFSIVILGLFLLLGGGAWFANHERDLRAQRAAADLFTAVERATEHFGQAAAAPVGVTAPWIAASAAAGEVRRLIDAPDLPEEPRRRALGFLARFDRADADRRMTEKIEDAVILGATHEDAKSWQWMERELREAFQQYGIDLRQMTNAEIVQAIRKSELAPQLTDGVELWLATVGGLSSMGVEVIPLKEAMGRLDVLYEADPDPMATEIRKLLYSQMPTVEAVQEIAGRLDVKKARPRTVAWLGTVCYRAGDLDTLHDLFRRALLEYPGDFMLNFDYAYNLVAAGRHDAAIRYYMRCLAIRPAVAGIWRALGNSYRAIGDFGESRAALEHSTRLQPNHAASWVDLGITYEAVAGPEAAGEAYRQALALDPESAPARERLQKLSNPQTAPEGENGAVK